MEKTIKIIKTKNRDNQEVLYCLQSQIDFEISISGSFFTNKEDTDAAIDKKVRELVKEGKQNRQTRKNQTVMEINVDETT